MTDQQPRKFTFDTVFDNDGAIAFTAPRVKRAFTADEVEQARAQAFAEGERSATVRAEEAQAVALADIDNPAPGSMPFPDIRKSISLARRCMSSKVVPGNKRR